MIMQIKMTLFTSLEPKRASSLYLSKLAEFFAYDKSLGCFVSSKKYTLSCLFSYYPSKKKKLFE